MPPTPVCIKFYIQAPLSLVGILPYASPLWFPNHSPSNYCTVPDYQLKL